MPTPISNQGQKELRNAKTEMIRLTRNKRRTVLVNDLLLLWWDQTTIDMVNTVKTLVKSEQLDAHSPSLQHNMKINHPVFPMELSVSFSLCVHEPNDQRILWPRDRAIRHDCNAQVVADLECMFNEIGAEAIDRGIFEDVCNFMIDDCPSYEAACYLFPPFLSLMRRAGMRQLANECEGDVKRAPKLPVMPYLMRNKIRHMNEWFAIQELLGTWESTRQPKPAGHTEVTLQGNTIYPMSYDGEHFTVNIV